MDRVVRETCILASTTQKILMPISLHEPVANEFDNRWHRFTELQDTTSQTMMHLALDSLDRPV